MPSRFQHPGIISDQVLHGVPGEVRKPGVDILDVTLQVGNHDADRALFHGLAKDPQLAGCLAAFGDIAGEYQHILTERQQPRLIIMGPDTILHSIFIGHQVTG